VRRSFTRDQVDRQVTRFALDELWVRRPDRLLRRPVALGTSILEVGLDGGSPETPGWERPLPPTAPGAPQARGAVLAGGLVAVALYLVAPILVALTFAPEPPGQLTNRLDVPPLAPAGVRAAILAGDRWSQRKALAAGGALEPQERGRLLWALATGPRVDLHVRLQAVRALEREPAAATRLLALEQTLEGAQGDPGEPTTRLAAWRGLSAWASDLRVRELASRRLLDRASPTALRGLCAGILAAEASGGGAALEAVVLDETTPAPVVGRASHALALVAPASAEGPLRSALRRLIRGNDRHAASLTGRALALVAGPVVLERELAGASAEMARAVRRFAVR
jgi:hypothetical protein